MGPTKSHKEIKKADKKAMIKQIKNKENNSMVSNIDRINKLRKEIGPKDQIIYEGKEMKIRATKNMMIIDC